MVEITEEPYDAPVALALVQDLLEDLNARYPEDEADFGDKDPPTDEDYLNEVTPEMTRAPVGTFLVAWVDGEPVGCGAVKPLHDDHSIGEIKRMYTRPAARGQGLSRLLLTRLEAVAGELGYTRLQLETGEAQPEAVALYASAGWHRIEPYGFYKDSGQSICFAKELDGT